MPGRVGVAYNGGEAQVAPNGWRQALREAWGTMMKRRMRVLRGVVLSLALGSTLSSIPSPQPGTQPAGTRPRYPWRHDATSGTVESRFAPPQRFSRLSAPPDSFASWLRGLPVKPGTPPVTLHDGRQKAKQDAHCAVLDVDVGRGDLQQCADAVIRLRAEYLYCRGCDGAIAFRFTSGDGAKWSEWKAGKRPSVSGNRVSWRRSSTEDGTYANFRAYLDKVFTYAGSASLARELEKVSDPSKPEPGYLYIQGGAPGHAVLVLDVAQDARGERVFLLAQSYMPAQEIHVLKNLSDPASPWYRARANGPLPTPEWDFEHGDLRRFPMATCP